MKCANKCSLYAMMYFSYLMGPCTQTNRAIFIKCIHVASQRDTSLKYQIWTSYYCFFSDLWWWKTLPSSLCLTHMYTDERPTGSEWYKIILTHHGLYSYMHHKLTYVIQICKSMFPIKNGINKIMFFMYRSLKSSLST